MKVPRASRTASRGSACRSQAASALRDPGESRTGLSGGDRRHSRRGRSRDHRCRFIRQIAVDDERRGVVIGTAGRSNTPALSAAPRVR
jgi:hypothetical protein